MGRGQPQYVMVTKQRRKSGCVAGFFHIIGGIFTLGMWPLMVWLTHRIGPKRKQVTYGYGLPPVPPQPQWQPPQQYGYQPQQPYGGYPPQPTMRQRPAAAPEQPTEPQPQWDPHTQQWIQPNS